MSLDQPPRSPESWVIYWMQAAQRVPFNQALSLAVAEAKQRRLPLVVVFVLSQGVPGANLRHYWFMVEGLREVKTSLEKLGLPFLVAEGSPVETVARLARAWRSPVVVCDRGYLRFQRIWRTQLAAELPTDCELIEVETEAVVPVTQAYDRQAWSAAALRPAVRRLLPHYLALPEPALPSEAIRFPNHRPVGTGASPFLNLDLIDTPAKLVSVLPGITTSIGPVLGTVGGHRAAIQKLNHFLRYDLARYGSEARDPARNIRSGLSPYLHFGQISALEIVTTIGVAPRLTKAVPEDAIEAFVEELVVRRELAMNYCWYNPDYDRYEGLPAWARRTLEAHRADPRPELYSKEELLAGATGDRWWNACQQELVRTGSIHGYMRMYWGKKIIEWTADPELAFATLREFNDAYLLDGRDCNGYAGIAWCFGAHDRPWKERPIFGQVRYMNAAGLERKFHMQAYAERIESLGQA